MPSFPLASRHWRPENQFSVRSRGKPAIEETEPDDAEKKFQKGLESILNYGVKKPEVNDEEVE